MTEYNLFVSLRSDSNPEDRAPQVQREADMYQIADALIKANVGAVTVHGCARGFVSIRPGHPVHVHIRKTTP